MEYHYYKIALEFLSAVSWPIVVLIIIYWLKDPISKFFKNIKSISHGDTRLETIISQKDTSENQKPNLSNINPSEILTIFSTSTLSQSRDIVEKEIGLNENNIAGREEILYDYAKLTLINRFFDKTYVSIYGSQIKILNSLNITKQSKEFLRRFYDEAIINYPGLALYNFNDYLNFLTSQGLIMENSLTGEVMITDLGRDFLKYINHFNFNLDLPN